MAVAAPILLGVAAAGSILQGVAGFQAGNANAKIDKAQAQRSQAQGAADESKVNSDARAAAGEAIASQGASGFQLGTGSALEQLRDNATNAGLDVLRIRTRAESERQAYMVKAHQDKASGQAALLQGFVGAASAIGGGFAGGAFGGAAGAAGAGAAASSSASMGFKGPI